MREQKTSEKNPYEDIIMLDHPEPRSHKRMPMANRAAQFAPFAALTGYEASLEETARLTESFSELSEEQKAVLDQKLMLIRTRISSPRLLQNGSDEPDLSVKIRYFVPDKKKDGGAYLTIEGTVRKIDDFARTIVMAGGESIPTDAVIDIEIS